MKHLIYIIFCLTLLSACYYPQQNTDGWNMSEQMQDSLDFTATHHYNVDYNFVVMADSFVLQHDRPMHNVVMPEYSDSSVVYRDDHVVVAQILIIPEDSLDSVWVKVARDQGTMGWVRESQLLEGVVPDEVLSQFIYTFSSEHLWYFLGIIVFVFLLLFVLILRRHPFYMVHFRDISSFYPTLLCLTLSTSTVLYASMQTWVPQTWVEYYYHPTLNPFDLPPILGLFIASIWLMLILLGAVVDELRRQLSPLHCVLYLFSLSGFCMICYLFFSIATLYWIGYPCLVLYAVVAVVVYWKRYRAHYLCGNCQAKMHGSGVCPRCGHENVAG